MASQSPDITDITILGGGPTGLFAAFYAGMRGVSCRIVDSLPELGGQLTALYPEKYIFDVGGFPKILARDLAVELVNQAMQFHPDVVLDEEIRELHREGPLLRLVGRSGEFLTRAFIIAGGKGAFEPRKLEVPGYDDLLGKGVHYAVKSPDYFSGKRLLIVGGGDSALDWALALKDQAARVVLAHRRDGFRAHERSLQLLEEARVEGKVEVWTFHEVAEIHGEGAVEGATVFDNRTGDRTHLEVDAVLTFLGFKPDLGPMKSWGLDINGNRIVVSQLMETNLPGVFGAGDVVEYSGKLDLIATGFAEAAIAVNNAVHHIDPKARVNPGHSTNLKVFKQEGTNP
ncbi:MAG: NAD(P)/FAD-dependent oxidoreductase [Gemmatimonadota bacterium]